jgi:TPR repeat protein
MYDKGQGVTQDDQQAYFWYSLSAAQGDEDAIKNRDVITKKLSTKELFNDPYDDIPF